MDLMPPPAHGLPRACRIRQARDFARARLQGRRLVQGCLILNWIALPPDACSRLGVITGKRIGQAVVRTRARRLLREAFRLHQQQLVQPVDVILVARPSIAGQPLERVTRDYLTALRKARLYREIDPSPGTHLPTDPASP